MLVKELMDWIDEKIKKGKRFQETLKMFSRDWDTIQNEVRILHLTKSKLTELSKKDLEKMKPIIKSGAKPRHHVIYLNYKKDLEDAVGSLSARKSEVSK